ncbi:hypothetical protein [Grimontia hollisae]|nr:hypothetical protein [Grimontia hollisae]
MIFKFSKIAKNTTLRYFKISSLANLYRKKIGMSIYRMSMLRIASRISNMLMMFIPIKIFILISTDSVIFSNLYDKDKLEYDLSLIILFSILILVFLVSVGSQYYLPRATSSQMKKLRGIVEKKYNDSVYSRLFISKSYIPMVNFISDLVIILISFLIYAFCSIEFTLLQMVFIISLYMLYDYILFTNNRLNILSRLSMTSTEFVAFSSNSILLVGFLLVFTVYSYGHIDVNSGVLILMVTRMLSGSLRGYAYSTIKIDSNLRNLNTSNNS